MQCSALQSTCLRPAFAVAAPRCAGQRTRATRLLASKEESLRQLEQFSGTLKARLAQYDSDLKSGRRTRPGAAATAASSDSSTVTLSNPTNEGELLEINADCYNAILDESGDKLLVVDFYTDWCGPCKMIYPDLVKLDSEFNPKARIVKFNCNKQNKELGISLGIKVAPTFHLYRDSKKIAEMTGAKVDKLRALIEQHLEPAGEPEVLQV